MSKSCKIIPDAINSNEESPIFIDLQGISNSREEQLNIWSTIVSAFRSGKGRELKIKSEPSLVESIDMLSEFYDITKLMSDETFANYAAMKEGEYLSDIESYNILKDRIENLSRKYDRLVPIIEDMNGIYSISLKPKTISNEAEFNKTMSLIKLNDSLIERMNMAGFAVGEVEDIGMPGMFSPANAEENAEGLKTAVKVSKNLEGIMSVPEEVAHVIVESMEDDNIMSRLKNILGNDDVLKEALGSEYEVYNALYDGNKELIIKEVIGKMIAYHLADRAGLNGASMYLSERLLNRISSMLSKISEKGIDNDILEAFRATKSIAKKMMEEDSFWDIVGNVDLSKAHTMFNTGGINSLESMTNNKIKILAKRIRVMQATNKDVSSQTYAIMNKVIEDYSRGNYTSAIVGLLKNVDIDCEKLLKDLIKIQGSINNPNASEKSKQFCRSVVRDIEGVIAAYEDCINELASISEEDAEELGMDMELYEEVRDKSEELFKDIGKLKRIAKEYKFALLADSYRKYWGTKDKKLRLGDKEEILTLEGVLQSYYGDVNGFSRQVNAMADMSDPMLQMVDMAYKDHSTQRDKRVFELSQRLAVLINEYKDASGSNDTKFMYEMDENGVPTGMFKSPYNFVKFNKAKYDFIKSVRSKYPEGKEGEAKFNSELKEHLKYWYMENTEKTDVGITRNGKTIYQNMPKLSKYASNSLESMSNTERNLYDAIMNIKRELDALVPGNYANNLYRAPQIKMDIKNQVLHNKGIGSVLKRIKDKFVDSVDDTEYGEHIVLDINNKPVKKVPVFFTRMLEYKEKKLLDTNAADAMLAYGAMAHNYTEMNKLADLMELTLSQMKERKFVQMSGSNKLMERFKLFSSVFSGNYTVSAEDSQAIKKLQNYIDSNIYGIRKNKDNITVGKTKFNVGKIADSFKGYSSLVGMGYNLFSGMTNVAMGTVQTFIQAGKNNGYYGVEDALWAVHKYNTSIAKSTIDEYSNMKDDKLNLSIVMFDALEEFNERIRNSQYGNGAIRRIISKHNPMLFNSMGEHFLHSISMLAMLHNTKVLVNGSETTLWDALEVSNKEIKDRDGKTISIPELKVVDGAKTLDGKDITSNYLFNLKMRINEVNRKMHGAYSETDKGDINRMAIGRLLMQFRQWMPAFYTERFRMNRYNIVSDRNEEGFYITFAKYLAHVPRLIKDHKFNILTNYKNMSVDEKINVNKAFKEIALLYTILAVIGLGFDDDGDDDPGVIVALKYMMYRVSMELGAAAPTSLNFVDNISTLTKSPLPCMQNIDKLSNCFRYSSWKHVYQSGRFEGWTEAERSVFYAIPYARNVDKIVNTIINGDDDILSVMK